jgi:hypothetical protein
MQIQLKQVEVEAALRMFITSQGINLTGKTVVVEFTSGRKDNGLSAELTIEDAPSSKEEVKKPVPETSEEPEKPVSLFNS